MTSKLVCFDLRPLQIGHENRGIGMVVKSVLEHLPNDKTKYLFYTFEKDNPIERLNINVGTQNYEIVQTPTLKHAVKKPRDFIDGLKITYHRFGPLKKYRPDVFVQFDIALGVPRWRRTRTYAVGYDLIPMIMRDEYLPSPLKALRLDQEAMSTVTRRQLATLALRPRLARHVVGLSLKSFKQSLRSAYHLNRYRHSTMLYKKVNGVLCISRATKASFHELLHIPKDKLFDFPLAPVLSTEPASSKIADKINKPYIFYIGGTDDRKRVQDVIYAYNILRGRGTNARLALAGNEFKKVEEIPNLTLRKAILDSPYKDDIVLTGFITDSEKLGLYHDALAFIFSSAYEGFGLPILEAAEMGCPVVAYDNSSISELASNDSALLVETGDFVGIANSVQQLSSDPELKKTLTTNAKKIASRYNWVSTVRILTKLISQ